MVDELEVADQIESVDAAEVYYDVALWQLQDQISRIDAMDRKLAAMFTLTAAVLALLSAGLAIGDAVLQTEAWAMLIAVITIFGTNVVSSYMAYKDRDWHLEPRLDDMESVSRRSEINADSARYWAAREMRLAIAKNEEEMTAKSRWLRISHGLMALDLLLAATTAIVITAPAGV